MRIGHSASKQSGVSLIELIFTVAIVGTLASISLPALAGLLKQSHARATITAMGESLYLARSSAIVRQGEVAICPSSDHVHCDDSVWWQHGWIVFVDTNGDGKRDANESVLQAQDAQLGMAIASSEGRKHISYRSDGGAPGTNLTLTFCDGRGPERASTLVLSNAGRLRPGVATSAQATTACTGLQL